MGGAAVDPPRGPHAWAAVARPRPERPAIVAYLTNRYAVDPTTGQVAYKYLTLDQSMMFIALANHLADGALQKRFAADPIVQRVLPLLGAENFFD